MKFKKKQFSLLFFIVFIGNFYSISPIYSIYSALLDHEYGQYPYAYVWVADKTSVRLLDQIWDFKKWPKEPYVDKRMNMLLTPAWRNFITSIDISVLKDSQLTQSFTSKIPVKLWKGHYPSRMQLNKIDWPLTIKNYKRPLLMKTGGIHTFSPVIFSKDGCKAILAVHWYPEPEGSSTSFHFFEKQPDGKWKEVLNVLTAIS